jgi:hypothetical protein
MAGHVHLRIGASSHPMAGHLHALGLDQAQPQADVGQYPIPVASEPGRAAGIERQ